MIASGTHLVVFENFAREFQVKQEYIRRATPDELLTTTGDPVGALSPNEHRKRIATCMHAGILDAERVCARGGASNHLLQTTAD